ncbi:MAG: peroxiredoxin [bacterium]|nr:peroxiredoxin [bacterium]
MLEINTNAPEFNLPDQNGKIHSLKDFNNQWVLLYFYPKDDTPGCTKEACSFRDDLPKFEKMGLQVLGISTDSVSSHTKFSNKYALNFLILSDESGKTIMDYEAGDKHANRVSYLINPMGIIVKQYPKVNPTTHATEVQRDLLSLLSSPK